MSAFLVRFHHPIRIFGVEGYKKWQHHPLRYADHILLRDPVERTCSSIRHTWRYRPNLSLEEILATIDPASPYYFRSDYGPTMDAVHSVFGEDRVRFSAMKPCFSENVIADFCKFLGISYHKPNFAHHTNVARTRKI